MPSLRIRQRDGRRSLLIVALSLALSASLLLVAPGRAWAAKYAKPTGLTATVSANTVALTWKAVKGAPGYRVQFSTEPKMNTFATLDVVKPYVEWTNLDMDPNRNAPRLSSEHDLLLPGEGDYPRQGQPDLLLEDLEGQDRQGRPDG